MKYGFFGDMPGCVRLSTCLRRLREQGAPLEAIEEVMRVHREHGTCPTHGHLDDPIIGTVPPDQIAIACPWCSGASVLAAWEAEGRAVLA